MQLEPIGSGWAAPGGRRPEQPAARGPNRGRRVSESRSQGPAPSPRPCGSLTPPPAPVSPTGARVGGPMASRGPAPPRCGGRAAESPPRGRPGPRAWAPAAQHSPAATTRACSASTATRRPRGDPHGRRPFRGGTSGSALTAAALPARWGRGPGAQGAGPGRRRGRGLARPRPGPALSPRFSRLWRAGPRRRLCVSPAAPEGLRASRAGRATACGSSHLRAELVGAPTGPGGVPPQGP